MNHLLHSRTGNLLKNYCSKIGKNSLLVQGAGGNASWKHNNILWVKASGTWLVDAIKKDIFVPIDLVHLQQEISNNNFSSVPRVIGDSNLKPSIETLLHALMPHKVVLHLHAIEILSHLVRFNPEIIFSKLIDTSINWSLIEYFKPGEDLAREVSKSLRDNSNIDVVFLKNHGVVIGGKSVEDIEKILKKLLISLKNNKNKLINKVTSSVKINNYALSLDSDINQLAINKNLSKRLSKEWALYPDHVVFLGSHPIICSYPMNKEDIKKIHLNKPGFVFVMGHGVLESNKVTKSQKSQLRCYFDEIIRQPLQEKLFILSEKEITDLLDWDAEKFRQSQSF